MKTNNLKCTVCGNKNARKVLVKKNGPWEFRHRFELANVQWALDRGIKQAHVLLCMVCEQDRNDPLSQ